MICVECRALLEEYHARRREHERALKEYRECLTQGLTAPLVAAQARAGEALAGVRAARTMYQSHRNSHKENSN